MMGAESLRYRAPASLEKKVRAALVRQDREERKAGWFRFQWPSLGATAAAATAALALVVLVWFRPAANTLDQEVVESHIRSLMGNHLMDVPSTDQHTVKPWFAGKLDFSPPVQDFSAEGFPLIGGRLDYLDGHPVAALLYRRNQHIINVFVWPVTTNDRGLRDTTRQGYHVIETIHGGMEYCLVSDLNQLELKQLGNRLTK